MNNIDFLGYIATICMIGLCIYIYFETTDFQLKCIVSSVDGNKYCVRDRNQLNQAANLLATVTQKCRKLVNYVYEKYPEKENVIRLYNGFKPEKIMETLPTSQYTAYSENKGERIAFCLNKNAKSNNENDNLIDEHTLTFVAIHELSHIATKSIGHKSEFWENFKFLLEEAKEANIHTPIDYSKQPVNYCGLNITDNPYYKK
jgi:predicted metal-dependent hydrolase